MTTTINEETFKEIISAEKLTLACFSATWCGPCQTMKPILQKIESDLSDKVSVVQIDVDQNLDLTVFYKIMGVPTLLLFRNGALLWRYSDVMKGNELGKIIASFQ